MHTRPDFLMSIPAVPDRSIAAQSVAIMTFGRPVLPPDVGAFQDGETTSSSFRTLEMNGFVFADFAQDPSSLRIEWETPSNPSNPTMTRGLATAKISLRSGAVSREEIGIGILPAL